MDTGPFPLLFCKNMTICVKIFPGFFEIIELFFEQRDHRRQREKREKKKFGGGRGVCAFACPCACACVCACLCPSQDWSGKEESQFSFTKQGISITDTM